MIVIFEFSQLSQHILGVCMPKDGNYRGSAKGTKHTQYDRSWKADLCKKYVESPKIKQKAFLCAELGLAEGQRLIPSFCKWLKQYKTGELSAENGYPTQTKKKRKLKYEDVEQKLVEYITRRADLYLKSKDKEQKVGLGYIILQEHAVKFAKECGYSEEEFKASPGWIANALKRSGKEGVNLTGEAHEMYDEQAQEAMVGFRTELAALIHKYDVPAEQVYNGDQTGLYFKKLPNRIYVDATQKKSIRGVKRMKDKHRLTVMVCTSAAGAKVPLAIVGKPKKPRCFRLSPDGKIPKYYKDQKDAWFDKSITKWWLWYVLLPHVKSEFGDVHFIIILDNCSAHKGIPANQLPAKCHLIFLPPNLTSRHQPADMGMISTLKVGYKTHMLRALLCILDDAAAYATAISEGERQVSGLKGLQHASDPHIWDAMEILRSVWDENNDDAKYATRTSIMRCWRKAAVMPAAAQLDLINEAGSRGEYKGAELDPSHLSELCSVMQFLNVACADAGVEVPEHLQDTFIGEPDVTDDVLHDMASLWVNIEDDPDVQSVEAEERMQEFIDNEERQAPSALGDSDTDDQLDDDGDEFDMLPTPSSPKAADALKVYAQYVKTHCSKDASDMLLRLHYKVKNDRSRAKSAKASAQLSVRQFAVPTPRFPQELAADDDDDADSGNDGTSSEAE